MTGDAVDKFVDSWGAMGSLWGVNTSAARVHALLIASDRPYCLDEISSRLRISKSNASTCLKDLRSWGVIHKVVRPGDRRDFWTCDPDVWKMLFNIMRERKRREFDPAYATVVEALASARKEGSGMSSERLEQMREMMGAMKSLADKLLVDEDRARDMLAFLTAGG